jgi:hypothetical protein
MQARNFSNRKMEPQFSEKTCRDGYKAVDVTFQPETEVQPEKESFSQLKRYFMAPGFTSSFENNGILFSKDEEPKKTPKGFEKFLKKTREGAKPSKETKKEEKKGDEKASKSKEEDDDDLTEEEVEQEKSSKKEKAEDSKSENAKKRLNDFFF